LRPYLQSISTNPKVGGVVRDREPNPWRPSAVAGRGSRASIRILGIAWHQDRLLGPAAQAFKDAALAVGASMQPGSDCVAGRCSAGRHPRSHPFGWGSGGTAGLESRIWCMLVD
jgi:hypothetical protein